jgi:murein DD-endopeptidase / murein LD-carboxypeptidase
MKIWSLPLLIIFSSITTCSAAEQESQPQQNGDYSTGSNEVSPSSSLIEDPPPIDGQRLLRETYQTAAFYTQLLAYLQKPIEKPIETGTVSPTQIIETAKSYLSTHHAMGGNSHAGIDCSGLVTRVFSIHGIHLERSSEDISRFGRVIIEPERLQAGDLVFFIHTYPTTNFITHVGIYLGEGMFIHTSSRHGVEIRELSNPYWAERYVFGTRVFLSHD